METLFWPELVVLIFFVQIWNFLSFVRIEKLKDIYVNIQYFDQKFQSWKSRYTSKLQNKPMINEKQQPRKKLAEAIDRRENGNFWDFSGKFWLKINFPY